MGIPCFFAYFKPFAFLLLLITSLILIGKIYSLDLSIKFLRLVPFPEINTSVFFYHDKELMILFFFPSLDK